MAALMLIVVAGFPARADACLAREPIARVLRQASGDLRACRARHALPDGRYLVRLVIDPTGKVERVELGGAPEHPGAAAESCIAAAFTRLRFETGYTPATRATYETVSGGGRRSRVPPDPRRRVSGGRGGVIVINWPWVFSSGTSGSGTPP